MAASYRSLGSWADVCALPDGRFVGVHAEMGQVVAQIIGGPVLWQTPVSTDILRYLRCAASAEHVCAIGVGADDHAYLVSAFWQLVLGPVGGQNAVAIGWNGRAFVMYRALYDPASREIKTYARRVSDTGSDVILPIPIGHTSQGFREAIPGPSPTEDRIIWSDNLHVQHVGGGVLHKPSERNGVIVGQVNGPDHIHGWNGSQFFHAIDGPAFEPHIATNGRGEYAIAARTGRGAAFVIVPPYTPIQVDQPPAPPVPPPTPPEVPPMSVPDRSAEVEAFIGPRLVRIEGNEAATRAKSFEALNACCVELNKTDKRFGLHFKTGVDSAVRDRTSDVLAYDLGNGTCQLIDVIGDAEGHDGMPRAGWGLVTNNGIRNISEWRAPYPLGGDDDDPGDTDPPKPPDNLPDDDIIAWMERVEKRLNALENARIELRLVL